MDPVDHLVAVWRGWVIITVMTLLGAVGGFLAGVLEAPEYRTTTSVLLVPGPGNQDRELGQLTSFMNNQVQSYAELVSSPVVLEAVISENNLSISAEELGRQIEAEVPVDTLVIEVSVVDDDPVQAAALANSTTRHLRSAVADFTPHTEADLPTVELRAVGQAQPPVLPDSPRRTLRAIAGTGLGLFIGVLLAIARHAVHLRDREERDQKADQS